MSAWTAGRSCGSMSRAWDTLQQCYHAGIGQLSTLKGLQHLDLFSDCIGWGLIAALAAMTGATTRCAAARKVRTASYQGFFTAECAVSNRPADTCELLSQLSISVMSALLQV